MIKRSNVQTFNHVKNLIIHTCKYHTFNISRSLSSPVVSPQQQVDVGLQQDGDEQRPLQEQVEPRQRQDVRAEEAP